MKKVLLILMLCLMVGGVMLAIPSIHNTKPQPTFSTHPQSISLHQLKMDVGQPVPRLTATIGAKCNTNNPCGKDEECDYSHTLLFGTGATGVCVAAKTKCGC